MSNVKHCVIMAVLFCSVRVFALSEFQDLLEKMTYTSERTAIFIEDDGKLAERISDSKYVIKFYKHTLPGFEPNPNYPPLLLSHGLISNSKEFRYYIKVMSILGYQVYSFNWPGFGKGEDIITSDRSFIPQHRYQRGDYRFEPFFMTIYPAVVQYLYHLEGRKIASLGHSMGGMAPFVSFITNYVNPDFVSHFTMVGSPLGFEKLKKMRRLATILKPIIIRYRDMGVESKAIRLTVLENDIAKAITYYGVETFANSILGNRILAWSTNVKNYHKGELGKALLTAISDTHPDILLSFLEFILEGFPYKGLPFPKGVQKLAVYGTVDYMVDQDPVKQNIYEQAYEHNHENSYLLGVHDMGHLDEVSLKATISLVSEFHRFFQNRYQSFGIGHHKVIGLRSSPPTRCSLIF